MFLQLLLDYLPALPCVGHDAPGAVLQSRWQYREVAGTGQKKERTVAKKAGVPVIEIVARQEFTFEVYEVFVAHLRIENLSCNSLFTSISRYPAAFLSPALKGAGPAAFPALPPAQSRNPVMAEREIIFQRVFRVEPLKGFCYLHRGLPVMRSSLCEAKAS